MVTFLSVEKDKSLGIYWGKEVKDDGEDEGIVLMKDFVDMSYFDAGDQRALLYVEVLEGLITNLKASAAAKPVGIGDL